MRSAFVIILLIFSLRSHGQANLKPIDSTQLLAGIRLAKGVESHFIGCYGSHSALHANVDSLINLIGRPAFESYFFDTSHILKYYAFLSILEVNEHLAFERLQQIIHDSSEIDYEFAGQNRGSEKFNALLAFHYYQFIKWKYYHGGHLAHDGKLYIFPRRGKKEWKAKKKLVNSLLGQNNVDTRLIQIYVQ